MATYYHNGKTYVPGVYIDPAERFAISFTTGTNNPLAIVANPNSTSANVEAFTLSTAGVTTIGGTSTGVSLSAGVTFSSGLTKSNTASVILGGTGELLGTSGLVSRLTFTGVYQVTYSTIAPAAAGGTSTQTFQRFPSTAFTFSTNDVILGVTLPSSYASTAALFPVFGGAFPTSSGAIALAFAEAPSTGTATTSTAMAVSTGAYVITVARTT